MLSFNFHRLFITLIFIFVSQAVSGQETHKADVRSLNIANTINNVYVISCKTSFDYERSSSVLDSNVCLHNEDLKLTLNTPRNVVIIIDKKSPLKNLEIYLLNVDTLKIFGNLKTITSLFVSELRGNKKLRVHSIQLYNSSIKEANLQGADVHELMVNNSFLKFLNLNNAKILSKFNLTRVRLDSSNFHFATLPDYITFNYLDLNRSGLIDLTNLLDLHSKDQKWTFEVERTIRLSNVDLDKFKLPYDRLNFHIDSLQDETRIKWVYEKLLKELTDRGLHAKYKWYNGIYTKIMDEKNHGFWFNTVNLIWWNRGYEKSKPLKIAISLFVFFTIINLLFFTKMLSNYYPNSLKKYLGPIRDEDGRILQNSTGETQPWVKASNFIRHVKCALIYTSFIFWGLRLYMEEMKIDSFRIYLYIIIQYLLGLLCVAYIVNFLVQR